MKLLLALLFLVPTLSYADMGALDVGFGDNMRPAYGLDYEFNAGLPYLDVALMANQDFAQPYISAGLQFEHFNFGLGSAITLANYHAGTFSGQITAGPEIGYMQNLTEKIYVKENNTYLSDFDGKFTYSATVSIGLNF